MREGYRVVLLCATLNCVGRENFPLCAVPVISADLATETALAPARRLLALTPEEA